METRFDEPFEKGVKAERFCTDGDFCDMVSLEDYSMLLEEYRAYHNETRQYVDSNVEFMKKKLLEKTQECEKLRSESNKIQEDVYNWKDEKQSILDEKEERIKELQETAKQQTVMYRKAREAWKIEEIELVKKAHELNNELEKQRQIKKGINSALEDKTKECEQLKGECEKIKQGCAQVRNTNRIQVKACEEESKILKSKLKKAKKIIKRLTKC